MTLSEYKSKLNELHDAIKENPFRRDYEVNMKYGKGYFDTVYKFAETFYQFIKAMQRNEFEDATEADKRLAKVVVLDFIHDFYAACNICRSCAKHYLETESQDFLDIIHEREELLELCISCIHGYLDTGMLDRYPFSTRDGIGWAEWNDETNGYEYVQNNKKEFP